MNHGRKRVKKAAEKIRDVAAELLDVVCPARSEKGFEFKYDR